MPLSQLHPALHALAVRAHRARRFGAWLADDLRGRQRATLRSEPLPMIVHEHRSLLARTLGGSPTWMQRGKVVNLRSALPALDGVTIRRGEHFSFWRSVGAPTAARGYVLGMQFRAGEVTSAIGGGLCQLASVVHWLALHSPLVVTERHGHSLDAFPDDRRTTPFGSGCTVAYNYLDFCLENRSTHTFQLELSLDDTHLVGRLRADTEPSERHEIVERDHRFVREAGVTYRENQLVRRVTSSATGELLFDETVARNRARVLYEVPR